MTVAAFREPKALSSDFFKTRARLPFSEMFLMAGIPSRILTNSEAVMTCARKLFLSLTSPRMDPSLTIRLWVNRERTDSVGDHKPYFRGIGRYLFAGFGGPNFLVVDLEKRRVAGRFSSDFAADDAIWRKMVFTVIVAMAAPTVGASVLHCAAVEHAQRGLILAGPSGSGKSTLSFALGQQGLGLLSDDRTCFSLQNERLLAWDMGGYWKLRPDAFQFLPDPSGTNPAGLSASDGAAIELEPEETPGVRRSKCCEPEWLVFLERQKNEGFKLADLSAVEAADRLEEGLYEESPEAVDCQRAIIKELVKRPCHILRYGGSPASTAHLLIERFESLKSIPHPRELPKSVSSPSPARRREDPLRRFTPLPHKLALNLMGRHGELQTNSLQVLECVRGLLPEDMTSCVGSGRFTWRIVAEDTPSSEECWPTPTALSADGLRVLQVDRRSFITVNTETAEGVGILPAYRVADTAGMAGVFMASLFYATAPALGLTPISASCVSAGQQGLLLLGVPASGKTSCAYAARKLGLDFHSDMVTFLENSNGRLLAHGEFWPALFRMETAQFFPEILYLGRALKHINQTFLSVDKRSISSSTPKAVTPTVAVYLERNETDTPRLLQLSPLEFRRILAASAPFEEEDQFQARRNSIFTEIVKIPAYRLVSRGDPLEAAVFCKSLLRIHEGIGAAR